MLVTELSTFKDLFGHVLLLLTRMFDILTNNNADARES